MGIETGGGDILFLNVSCGRLKNKAKNIEAKGYTGYVTDISRKDDEYEGKVTTKVVVSMRDNKSDQLAKISFTEESYFSVGFFSQIKNADFSKPITFGVSGSQENEKVSFCWLSQDNQNLVRDKDFPKPEKTKIGRNLIMDWTKLLEQAEVIIQWAKNETTKASAALASAPRTPSAESSELSFGSNDDLPF